MSDHAAVYQQKLRASQSDTMTRVIWLTCATAVGIVVALAGVWVFAHMIFD